MVYIYKRKSLPQNHVLAGAKKWLEKWKQMSVAPISFSQKLQFLDGITLNWVAFVNWRQKTGELDKRIIGPTRWEYLEFFARLAGCQLGYAGCVSFMHSHLCTKEGGWIVLHKSNEMKECARRLAGPQPEMISHKNARERKLVQENAREFTRIHENARERKRIHENAT